MSHVELIDKEKYPHGIEYCSKHRDRPAVAVLYRQSWVDGRNVLLRLYCEECYEYKMKQPTRKPRPRPQKSPRVRLR